MRATMGTALILALIGCASKNTTASQPTGPSHPDLLCPKDAVPMGAVPPQGYEAWCTKATPAGQWLKEGPYLEWYQNGQKKVHGEYLVGRQHGPWTFFFATGEVLRQGSFAGGVEEGFWIAFYTSGETASEGTMIEGKEHGPWVYYGEDDQTRTEGQWELGKRDGVWLTYDASDTPRSERVYRMGRLISQREL